MENSRTILRTFKYVHLLWNKMSAAFVEYFVCKNKFSLEFGIIDFQKDNCSNLKVNTCMI